jgi:riboflavin kinase
MELQGTVTTGLGKGAYYIGLDEYQQLFNNRLGFKPFPGTLNLDVDPDRRQAFMEAADTVYIPAPVHDGERMSAADAHKITINEIEGALLDLEITDHPDSIAEIIAPINLRNAYGLEDGDTVTVMLRT